MSYENTDAVLTIGQIAEFIAYGKIKTDNIVQRGAVWSPQQKSLLIHSAVSNMHIPELLAATRTEEIDGIKETVYDMIDGKQRVRAIDDFINKKFKLRDVPVVTYRDAKAKKNVTYDMSGKRFLELPEELKKIITGQTIHLVCFSNATQNEITTMFIRYNNGRALSSKSKNIAYCNDLPNLLKIGQHPLFHEMLSKKARENKTDAIIIAETWCMLNKDIKELSFTQSKLQPILRDLSITKGEEKELQNVFDYAVSVYEYILKNSERRLARMFVKETHFVSLSPYIHQAIQKAVRPSEFAEQVIKFYKPEDKTSIDEVYNEASSNAVASPIAIQNRDASLKKFFKKVLS